MSYLYFNSLAVRQQQQYVSWLASTGLGLQLLSGLPRAMPTETSAPCLKGQQPQGSLDAGFSQSPQPTRCLAKSAPRKEKVLLLGYA